MKKSQLKAIIKECLNEGRMGAKQQAESIAMDVSSDIDDVYYNNRDRKVYVDDEMGVDVSDLYAAFDASYRKGMDAFETAMAKELTKQFKKSGMK